MIPVHHRTLACLVGLLCVGAMTAQVAAQQSAPDPSTTNPAPATQPSSQPTTQTADQPAGSTTKPINLKAKVIEVVGKVETAAGDAEPVDESKWSPVNVGDVLEAGSQIRTSVRSRCVLMFGSGQDATVISIQRATLAKIIDFYRTQSEQRVRMGLGYGAIRGGSTQGTLRSDVIIDSAVATLAKRGTEGFEIEVEPISGYYRLSLARYGLVDAYADFPPTDRTLGPGEYVTNETVARTWISQDIFDRTVQLFEMGSVSSADLSFMTFNGTGLSSLAPGAGSDTPSIAGRSNQDFSTLATAGDQAATLATVLGLQTLILQNANNPRAEGNFGFGPTFRLLAPHR